MHAAAADKDVTLGVGWCWLLLQRLRTRQATNPEQFELLFSIIDEEVARKDHNHSKSCTKGLLWLKRCVVVLPAAHA